MEGQSCVLPQESVHLTRLQVLGIVSWWRRCWAAQSERPRASFLRELAGGWNQMLPGLSETERGLQRIQASPCAREGGGNGWQRRGRIADWMEEACCSGWLRCAPGRLGRPPRTVQFSAAPASQHGPPLWRDGTSLGEPGGPGRKALRQPGAAAGNQEATADLTTCGVLACSAALKPLQDLVGQSRNTGRGPVPTRSRSQWGAAKPFQVPLRGTHSSSSPMPFCLPRPDLVQVLACRSPLALPQIFRRPASSSSSPSLPLPFPFAHLPSRQLLHLPPSFALTWTIIVVHYPPRTRHWPVGLHDTTATQSRSPLRARSSSPSFNTTRPPTSASPSATPCRR